MPESPAPAVREAPAQESIPMVQQTEPIQPTPVTIAAPEWKANDKLPSLVPNYVMDDKSDSDDEDEELDDPVRPQYNLRHRLQAVVQNVLYEESPNVIDAKSPCRHQGRFQQAVEVLRVQEAFKSEMYTPIGMFAGAVIDPDTGKALEYRDRRWGSDRLSLGGQYTHGRLGHI